MEQFLLKNAKVYETLVSRLTPSTAAPNVSSLTGGRREQARTNGTHHVADPNMVVSARIRPFLDEDVAAGFPNAMFPRSAEGGQQQQGVVDIHDLYNHPRGRPLLRSYNYQVDRLFDGNTSTQTIYDELVADLITFAQAGGIATLFAYGQTGSGKTYTISQLEQLAIEALMTSDNTTPDSATNDKQYRHEISVMIVELAGNSVFDLLGSTDGEDDQQERKPVAVRDDASGTTQLVGATEHIVTSKNQVLGLVEQAASFRRSAPTFKNAASSRSHAVCRIRIRQKRVTQGKDSSAHGEQNDSSDSKDGFLYLIDLAGSEAARDIAAHGNDRMRETREINISLSVLKDCIRGKADADAAAAAAAARNKPAPAVPRIPYRQAALTRVLRHIFEPAGGSGSVAASQACRTVVIACVNPSLADVGASKNTLRYAELLRVSVPAKGGSQIEAQSQTQHRNGNAEGGTPLQTRPQAPVKTTKPPASSTTRKDTKALPGIKATARSNTRDPNTWDNTKLKEWIGRKLESSMAASSLAANNGGAAFLQLSSDELDQRRLTLGSDALSTQQVQGLIDQMRALQPR